jgi:Xaa-Pro aminopeptidase
MTFDYKARRSQLLATMPLNSIAFLFAKPQQYRNHDTEYRFRQDSSFYYLTGLNEPDLVLLLVKTAYEQLDMLFCHPYDERVATWLGTRVSAAEMVTQGFDQAYSLPEFEEKALSLLAGKEVIFSFWDHAEAPNQQLLNFLKKLKENPRKGLVVPHAWQDLGPLLYEQRVIKSAEEIKTIQHAIDISIEAHKALMAMPNKVGLHEYVLEAKLLDIFYQRGASDCAYPSIIGAGDNACILHYHQNRALIKENDLILIDAGAEYDFYASDITRTIPASGRYTTQQKELYQVVLAAQCAGIAACQVGKSYHQIQEDLLAAMIPGLLELGILTGSLDEVLSTQSYQAVYMHSSGHYLGLDVHDCGRYKTGSQWRLLEPNMILTVEPGVYIRRDHPTVPKKWHGLGIRIEDDILISKKGPRVLSEKLPKAIEAVEALAV